MPAAASRAKPACSLAVRLGISTSASTSGTPSAARRMPFWKVRSKRTAAGSSASGSASMAEVPSARSVATRKGASNAPP
eukprot:scaffold273493_cov31-Tisochrysis_lutea.AAC.2